MSKHKPTKHGHQQAGRTPPPEQVQQGRRAFQAGRYDLAIMAWSRLPQSDERVRSSLAEAHFRRALAATEQSAQLADLRQAIKLAPAELRFQYHLGLALHRAGELDGAIAQYRAVLARDPNWAGAAQALALATLEHDARADLSALPGSTAAIRATFAPVQLLLQGGTPTTSNDTAFGQLWRGLGLLRQGDPTALAVLDDRRPLAGVMAPAVRRYYKGVAAAQAQDLGDALQAWQHVAPEHFPRPWLRDNLAVAVIQRLQALATDQLDAVVELALSSVPLAAGNAALGELLIQRLDQAAHSSALAGDWERATKLWEAARQVMSLQSGLGSPRALLHNVALAYERQERWMEAAEAWRAMLRTRPRKASRAEQPAAGELAEEQWAWIRRRVIEVYKRAGAPQEAVTVYRQAVKLDPQDLETRLQLVEALLANDQLQAGSNEVQRVLEIDPAHVGARLMQANIQGLRGEWQPALQTTRSLLDEQPNHVGARRLLIQLLLDQAEHLCDMMQYAAASDVLREGQQIDPDNYRFPLMLAQTLLDQHQPKDVGLLLQRTLDLAPAQPAIYMEVIDCWVTANNLDEARKVLTRAETALTVVPELYMSVAFQLLDHTAPLPFPNLFGPPQPFQPPKDTPWSNWARELLEKAFALRPDDAELYEHIAAGLALKRPDWATEYAEQAVKLAPNRPDALITLGLALGLNDRTKEAKEQLRRAIRLARQQGRPDLVEHAEGLLHEVGNPMLRMSLQMGMLREALNDDDLELPDWF